MLLLLHSIFLSSSSSSSSSSSFFILCNTHHIIISSLVWISSNPEMILVSFPTTIYSNKQIPLSIHRKSHHNASNNRVCCNFDSPFSHKSFIIQSRRL
ncbi:hypothetical protein ACMBCN_01335, partial [Candidatus Liberibacter asiaticus]|nr:hypothetical protein [Candidatus Liberibacter asiaticus]